MMNARVRLKLILFLALLFGLAEGQSSEDLVYVPSPLLETIFDVTENKFSSELEFQYSNFNANYISTCRIGTNITFAYRNSSTGGVLVSINESNYEITGGLIGTNGTFRIKIRGNTEDQHDRCLVCGFATNSFITQTSCIRLNVTFPPVISLKQVPESPKTNEEVKLVCEITAFPFPVVRFRVPRNLEIEKLILTPYYRVLKQVRYTATIPHVDVSWDGLTVDCEAENATEVIESESFDIFVRSLENKENQDNNVVLLGIIFAIIGTIILFSVISFMCHIALKRRRKRYYFADRRLVEPDIVVEEAYANNQPLITAQVYQNGRAVPNERPSSNTNDARNNEASMLTDLYRVNSRAYI